MLRLRVNGSAGSLMDRPMRILNSIAPVALLLASPAFAQTPPVAGDDLVQGVACTAPEARSDLNAKIRAARAEGETMTARLNQISADGAVCQAIRDAAKDLATAYAQEYPAQQDEIVKASRAIVAETLAEAEPGRQPSV